MNELTVVDTFGGLNPHAVPYLIKKVKERINDKPIFGANYELRS